MTQILLVDDHQIVRTGLRMLLESDEKLVVTDEVGSAEDALVYLEKCKAPNLVLTDLQMKEMDGIALIKVLKKVYPEVKVAVLSMSEDQGKVIEAFDAGADGYLSKAADYTEILFGIQQIAGGNRYMTTSLSLSFMQNYKNFTTIAVDINTILKYYDISEREFAVLELIAEGLTNGEIADKIFLSKRTVEGYRQHLLEKTNTRNTAQLVRFAFRNNLLK
ncbi:response regulator transcription factor [Sphingobacterium sp. HMA12]|uniref:response regulator transcription factor n=1 Tax=Sphingobacterium sp. HMA12 TaxID=2050894 RepID=UPI000CEA6C58|nr:response regulator transcription factor [Sphingobacterium sp. HMA12]